MDHEQLLVKIEALKIKHQLSDFGFDTEYIYDMGDLTRLLIYITQKTLTDLPITITETYSDKKEQYVATLICNGKETKVHADTFSDWLPDTFEAELQQIPVLFNTGLLYYSINPAIGLTGQDAWYFCGTEANLKAARKEGLPLIFPGEHPLEADEYRLYNEE